MFAPGRGSDARRKAIINGTLSKQQLFTDLMEKFRDGFREKADEAQKRVHKATTAYLRKVEETFDLVRSENAVKESEQDPEFRERVENVSQLAGATMQNVHRAIGN